MEKKIDFHWNVWVWNVNSDSLDVYDVGSYFLRCYKELPKSKRPVTLEEVNEFLVSNARYEYCARCEYEMIIHSWPKFKNDIKADVYDQLRLNWDVFVDTFYKAITK